MKYPCLSPNQLISQPKRHLYGKFSLLVYKICIGLVFKEYKDALVANPNDFSDESERKQRIKYFEENKREMDFMLSKDSNDKMNHTSIPSIISHMFTLYS